jgi:two-component system LytT family response regulator
VKTPIENFELEPTHDFESFSLATNKGILVFRQADIVRLEASGSYTIFSIQNQNPVLASYTLSDFEKKLNPAKFIRVHKSHIVNLDYIVKYTKGDGGVLTLSTGTEIPVSRSRKEELLEKLHTVK